MSKSVDYNELFSELQKNCNAENCCNAFANITLEELIDYECGDKVLKLYKLADTLFSRDLS